LLHRFLHCRGLLTESPNLVKASNLTRATLILKDFAIQASRAKRRGMFKELKGANLDESKYSLHSLTHLDGCRAVINFLVYCAIVFPEKVLEQ